MTFEEIKEKVLLEEKDRNTIGILSEKTMHAILKDYYEPNRENQEIKIGNYHADILNDHEIIEIQTRNLGNLRPKLSYYLPNYPVRVVHPLSQTKTVIWINPETGEFSKPHKSPKKATIYDAIKELYKIKMMLDDANLTVDLVFLDSTEYRYQNGYSRNGKKGSVRCELIPNHIYNIVSFTGFLDYFKFLEPVENAIFTTKNVSSSCHITRSIAQTLCNILCYIGAIQKIGKQKNEILYQRVLEN